MSDCTYQFDGPDGKPVTIRGLAAMKAFLAEGGLQHFGLESEQSSQSVVKFSGKLSAKRAAEAIRQVARETAEDFFRLPTSSATDMLEIAGEIGQGELQVFPSPEVDRRATKAWTLRVEGEKRERRYHRDAYIFENAYGMVWVNVGALETGDQGGRVYQIAGAYAHNNGLRFIGDPDGITEAGKRRRLENMIGLALKYGDTKFLAPHVAMQGWNRLVWDPKSDDNLLPMLQASYNFVSRIYPEIKDVEFSLDTGRFRRAGADLGRDDFEGMAGELRGRLGADATGAPGSGTLRLAALYRSLVQEEDPEGRVGVLLADGDGRTELVRSLTEVRYSTKRDPYANIEVRPGTTEGQRAAGRSALRDLLRRVEAHLPGGKHPASGPTLSLLGAGIYRDLAETGAANLLGQQVSTPADLATLAQVFRDPRFETFRVFFTKHGAVVGETAYTSRLPAAVPLPLGFEDQIREDLEGFEADGYWVLHNHPSGASKPSNPDVRLTELIANRVAGFLGHVVIDHNEYSVIDADGAVMTIQAPELNGTDFSSRPELEHVVLGIKIGGPADVATLAKALQVPGGHATAVFAKRQGDVQLLVDMPAAALQEQSPSGMTKLKAVVRRAARAGGVNGNRFLVLPRGASVRDFTQLVQAGLFTDVVSADGVSLREEGVGHPGDFMDLSAKPARRQYATVPVRSSKLSRSRTISDLSPAQEAAADRVLGAPKTFADRWQAFKKDWAKNMKQGIFDQFAPLLDLDPQAYMLARLSKGGDSTLEALMLYGKLRLDATGATDVDYDSARGYEGFASKMAPLGQEQDRFLLWVAAQRADRLKQIGLENLWSDQDIQELRGLDQGVMPDGTGRSAVYAQALADLNAFNDNVLSIAEGSGLISPETRQMYQDQPYVPFYRLQEEGVAGFGMKPGIVNQAAWKRLKGGTEKIHEDLLANLLKNWSHLITASARNRAARATLEAATRAGVATPVPASTPGQDLVRVRVQGSEQAYAVLDPHLLDAVSALEYAGLGPWSKPLTAAKHWLTVGVTANPTFKLRNLMRDSISAIGTAQLSYNPAKNIGKGWGSTSKAAETRAHMLAAGGMIRFGSMLEGNSSRRAQTLIERGVDPALILDSDSKIKDFWNRRVMPAIDAYNELGDRVENINRAALYDQMVARGMSHMEASYWARDMMDFSMSGKWTAIRGLVQVVPFFNARLQGLYKLGRAGTQDIRRLGTVLGAVSLFSLALLFAAKGDDDDWKDWQARTDEDRNNYWWFKAGGLAFRIPKPFEIGAVGTIAERGFEIMSDDEMTPKRFGKVMSQIVLSQLSMNPTPQLFKPMMDVYANQDAFTGMPIEGPALEGMRKADRYDSRTSTVARFLGSLGLPNPTQLVMGRWDELSPKQIDYLARGYFSWLATMTTTALDYGIRPLIDAGDRPARSLKETFFVGNFVETLPANGSRYVQRLYDQAREVEEAYGSYRARIKVGDVEGAQRVLSEERDKIARARQVAQFKQAESMLTLQQRRIEEDQNLSGVEKRSRLDAIQQRKNLLAEQFPGV